MLTLTRAFISGPASYDDAVSMKTSMVLFGVNNLMCAQGLINVEKGEGK